MNDFKRTKIIATLGPAITGPIFTWEQFNKPSNEGIINEAYSNIEKLIEKNVSIFRLNFSHGTYEEQDIRIKIIKEVAKKLNKNIGIMLDTKGPEIRVGAFYQKEVQIKISSYVDIYTKEKIIGDETKFYVTDSTETYNMAKDVKVNNIILVDDGKLQLQIIEIDVEVGKIKTQALNTHIISQNKRINLPNTKYSLPFISEKDRNDIKYAVDNNLDYIALSFVNNVDNIKEIKKILKDLNAPKRIQLISKIESTDAINNVNEIVNESDGIMVARGDLALEIPFYNIPYWQKYLIKACRFVGKPCIIATQMLDSLEKNIQPTRAEVTDVFFAVDKGADATMLSGETAKGMFPINAVSTMAIIDVTAEKLFDYKRAIKFYFKKTSFNKKKKAIAKKIAKKVLPKYKNNIPNFKNDFVVIFGEDKEMVLAISTIRPAATILLVTSNKTLLRMFSLNYGIQTYYYEDLSDLETNYNNIAKEALSQYNYTNSLIFYKNKFHKIK